MSVFGSKILVFAPECWKCTVRSPDLKKFLGVGGSMHPDSLRNNCKLTRSFCHVLKTLLKPPDNPWLHYYITVQFLASLQKHTFLLTHHRWGTFRKERKGKSVTQQQNFYTDEVKSVQNPVISTDWTMELFCCFSYYLRTKNINTMNLWQNNQYCTLRICPQCLQLVLPRAGWWRPCLGVFWPVHRPSFSSGSLRRWLFVCHSDCYHFHGPR